MAYSYLGEIMKKIILVSLSVLVLLTGCKKEKETKIIEEQKNQSNESSVVESQPLEVNLSFEEKVEEFGLNVIESKDNNPVLSRAS